MKLATLIKARALVLYGAWPVLHTSLLVMNRLNKAEFASFICLMWSLFLKDLTDQKLFIFTAAGVGL